MALGIELGCCKLRHALGGCLSREVVDDERLGLLKHYRLATRFSLYHMVEMRECDSSAHVILSLNPDLNSVITAG